jgi:hypothetical protein
MSEHAENTKVIGNDTDNSESKNGTATRRGEAHKAGRFDRAAWLDN